MAEDIKWIKISINIFDNRKIKQIETLPDGDALIVIWMKLLCLAGNINDSGLLYITEEIPYNEQTLATQFNRPLPVIQLALKTFREFGMIEIIDDVLHISNWEKYQNIDYMERVKLQNRERVARFRENKKREKIGCNVTVTLPVTQCNAIDKIREEEIRKEDIREDIENLSSEEDKYVDSENESTGGQRENIDYKSIANEFNRICVSLPKVNLISDKRQKAIKARIKTYGQEKIIEAFEKAEASDFLKGKNNRNWSADFDWIMKDSNMAKILDGNYDNNRKAGRYAGDDSRTEAEASRWDTEGKQYYGLKI